MRIKRKSDDKIFSLYLSRGGTIIGNNPYRSWWIDLSDGEEIELHNIDSDVFEIVDETKKNMDDVVKQKLYETESNLNRVLSHIVDTIFKGFTFKYFSLEFNNERILRVYTNEQMESLFSLNFVTNKFQIGTIDINLQDLVKEASKVLIEAESKSIDFSKKFTRELPSYGFDRIRDEHIRMAENNYVEEVVMKLFKIEFEKMFDLYRDYYFDRLYRK